jgi:hypothetical protein
MTLAQLDNIASGMERRWGIDRLPALMPNAWRAKFDTLKAALDTAIANGADTDAPAAALIKAWQLMDAKATEQGSFPVAPALEVRTAAGRIIAITPDAASGHAASLLAQWERREVTVWAANAMVAALEGNPLIQAIHAQFAGALVTTPPAEMRAGKRKANFEPDEIPFPNPDAEEAA